MIRSTANGYNQSSHKASLTIIILLETGTIHYRNLSHSSWIFYIHYYVNS
jgi:hypothetical protein